MSTLWVFLGRWMVLEARIGDRPRVVVRLEVKHTAPVNGIIERVWLVGNGLGEERNTPRSAGEASIGQLLKTAHLPLGGTLGHVLWCTKQSIPETGHVRPRAPIDGALQCFLWPSSLHVA